MGGGNSAGSMFSMPASASMPAMGQQPLNAQPFQTAGNNVMMPSPMSNSGGGNMMGMGVMGQPIPQHNSAIGTNPMMSSAGGQQQNQQAMVS